MFKEIIFLDKIEYAMNGQEMFYGMLAVIKDLRLRLDSIDYDGRRIVAVGNVKAEIDHDMIKQSAFGGKAGLYLAFPLAVFSKSIYCDRLILAVGDIDDNRSVLNLYGRLNYGNVGSPTYAKPFNIELNSLLEKLRAITKGVRNEQVIAEMKGLMADRTIFSLSWVTLLTVSAFVVVLLYLLYGLF